MDNISNYINKLKADEIYNPDYELDKESLIKVLFPDSIDERTKDIVYSFYFKDETQEDIGKRLRLTRQSVNNIICKYRGKMKRRYKTRRNLMRRVEGDNIRVKDKQAEMKALYDNRENTPVLATLARIAELKKEINNKKVAKKSKTLNKSRKTS